jgi:hypothetical protein
MGNSKEVGSSIDLMGDAEISKDAAGAQDLVGAGS